jgi:cytoskeletal protein CcmA (bactofilin family)
VLDDDCHMDGELILENDAIIEGEFHGTLRVNGELDLPQTAEVTGTVVVGNLRLAGRARADVIATESVELVAGAELNGRVFTPHLTMGQGVVFQGEATVGPASAAAAEQLLSSYHLGNTEKIDALAGSATSPAATGEQGHAPVPARANAAEKPQAATVSAADTTSKKGADRTGIPPRAAGTGAAIGADGLSTSASAFSSDAPQVNEPDFGTMLESVLKVLRRRRPPKALSPDPGDQAA